MTKRPVVPEGYPPLRPAWFLGPNLQTLSAQCQAGWSVSGVTSREIRVPLSDDSGDELVTVLDVPPNRLQGSALVVLIHGLTGSAESPYVRSLAHSLHEAGQRTVRVSLRGCGASAECRRIHHPAATSDLGDLFDELVRQEDGRLVADGIYPVGMSLGGDTLLKFLGEGIGTRPIIGAAAVSPTLELAHTTAQIESAWLPYARLLLRWMKQEYLRPTAAITEAEQRTIDAARSITDLHDSFSVPHFGHANLTAFYAACAAVTALDDIRVPTAVFHGADDPLVPRSTYDGIDWTARPHIRPFLVEDGGHVGFVERPGRRWHHTCLLRLLHELRTSGPA